MREARTLAVAGLGARYGTVPALADVDLHIDRGEIVTLVGANGAGKSTLIKAICGLVKPSAGTVRLYGEDVTGRDPDALVRLGMAVVPEGRRLFPEMTLLENLELGAYARTDTAAVRRDLTRTLELFPELADRLGTKARAFSGGQQQMIAVARALMSAPKILLLDEPTIGLAPAIVARISEIIATIAGTGVEILLVEQNAEMALALAHRAYILEGGTVVADGPADVIANSPEVQRAYLGI